MKKTTTTKDQIMDYLQWSSKDYEDYVFKIIWNWCQNHGKYPSVIQQLMANAEINRWFMTEYEKHELQFLKMIEVVPHKVALLRDLYHTFTIQIMPIYPKALLDSIKRNRDFSNEFLTNTLIYYAN